jgi:2,3,4,5-tetrahydropyridine-2-carboxylate N-succinyltransferase
MVNEWIKKAVAMHFLLLDKEFMESGQLQLQHKQVKKIQTAWIDPNAIIRQGSHIADTSIIMSSMIDTGVHIETGTWIENYASIGPCTQIGSNVHICCGVNITESLKHPEKFPVIIENDCYIGPQCVLSEGIHIEKGVILGPHVVLSGASEIIDTSGRKQIKYKGMVPAGSIVIRGYQKLKSRRGRFVVPCAFIIGKHDGTDSPETILEKSLISFRKN